MLPPASITIKKTDLVTGVYYSDGTSKVYIKLFPLVALKIIFENLNNSERLIMPATVINSMLFVIDFAPSPSVILFFE